MQAALVKWADCERCRQEVHGCRRRHCCADWLRQWKHVGNAGQRCIPCFRHSLLQGLFEDFCLWVCRPIEIGACWELLFQPEWACSWRGRCRCAWCHNIEQLSRCCCTWRQHGRGWELEYLLGCIVCIFVFATVVFLWMPCRRVHWTPQVQLQLL